MENILVWEHTPIIQKQLSPRQIRWTTKLAEYEYEIKYKPGKNNTAADALSRRVNVIVTLESCPIFKESVKTAYEEDPDLHILKTKLLAGVSDLGYELKNNLIYKNNRLVIAGLPYLVISVSKRRMTN